MRSPEDIHRMAVNKYREFLREHFAGRSIFPYEIPFGRPRGGRELDRIAEESRRLHEGSIARLGHGYTVETALVSTMHGQQRLPVRVYFSDAPNYLRYIGKADEFARLEAEIAALEIQLPIIIPWARQHPQEVLLHAGHWPELCQLLGHLLAHPRPGCYPRELPLPVSGKLLGDEYRVICAILSTLPGPHWQEGEDYFAQLGLRRPPASLVRFRFLDPLIRQANGFPLDEVAVSSDTLALRPLHAFQVFITENLMTYLSFPNFPGALLFLGEGNAAARLGGLGWLTNYPVTYWGDLDPYGFVILDRLRQHFPHINSMLMDTATLSDYEHLGVTANRPLEYILLQLSPDELAVASALYERSWSIEQEKIPQQAVAAYLRSMAPIGF